jgi:hypothetical protein
MKSEFGVTKRLSQPQIGVTNYPSHSGGQFPVRSLGELTNMKRFAHNAQTDRVHSLGVKREAPKRLQIKGLSALILRLSLLTLILLGIIVVLSLSCGAGNMA